MIETELKAKCRECNELSSITRTSRIYIRYDKSLQIRRVSVADFVAPMENEFFLCSLGCLIKFIASEADNARL